MHYYYQPMTNGYDWWGAAMALVWLLFFILVGLFAWYYLKKPGTASDKPSPLDIASERYAKGEIDKAQFEQIKKDLTK